MSQFGIDYAWHDALDPGALRSIGVTFAARYLSHDPGKNLTLNEAKALSSAGLDIVTVWESTANRADSGADGGAADAAAAVAQAQACQQPHGSGIYFAVDFDTIVGPLITGYASRFTAVCHAAGYRSGVYGSYTIVEQCFAARLVDLGWQTYAWSGGRVSSHANLYQYSNAHRVAGLGGECDYDRALTDDFGQWRIGAPPPVPGNRFSSEPVIKLGSSGKPVVDCQNNLNILLHHENSADPARLVPDGVFGPRTDDTVRRFQAASRLAADGVVGPLTWSLMAFELSLMHR